MKGITVRVGSVENELFTSLCKMREKVVKNGGNKEK